MTSCTAFAVAGATLRVLLTTCDTVETDTRASRATSAMVATPPPDFVRQGLAKAANLAVTNEDSISKRLRNRFDALSRKYAQRSREARTPSETAPAADALAAAPPVAS